MTILFSEKEVVTEGLFYFFGWAEPAAIREECVFIVLEFSVLSMSLFFVPSSSSYTHLLVHALRVIIVRCGVCVCVLIFPCFLYIYFFLRCLHLRVPFRSSFRSPRRV
jgi:hypothetical protein